MNERMISYLASLLDHQLFSELADGLEHLRDSAVELHGQACFLAQAHHPRGSWILNQAATEEASKFLMLLDAARCPRNLLSNHLCNRKFYGHLARGIYAKACGWRPGSFGEFRTYVERERESLHLDGPNGVDWIYRNSLLEERENTMYVDYVKVDDGFQWSVPNLYPDTPDAEWFVPLNGVVKLVENFIKVGVATSSGVEAIAKTWRQLVLTDDIGITRLRQINWATVQQLASMKSGKEPVEAACRDIAERWPFPMYALDLKLLKVDRAILEQQR